jgi:hypothetical protein
MQPSTILGQTAALTRSRSAPFTAVFEKTKVCIETTRFSGEKMALAFPSSIGLTPMVRHGETLGAVVTFVDITERKQAYEQIQKLKTKLEAENVYLREEIRTLSTILKRSLAAAPRYWTCCKT